MLPPAGLVDPARPDLVCKLNKALYGLKQAPRLWHAKIDTFLVTDLGFVSSGSDPCLYCHHTRTSSLLVALYVDNLLISGDTLAYIDHLKSQLARRFAMKDLVLDSTCLGL